MSRFQTFRILVVSILVLLTFVLFHTQLVKGPYYYRLSEHNRIRLIPLLGPRGNVYDRSGILMAGNRPSYNVSVIPSDFDSRDIPRLSKILKMSSEEIQARIQKGRKVSFMPVVLKQGIDLKTLFRLEESRPDFAGVLIQVESVRHYPFGKKSAHLLGYVGRVSQQELDHDEEGRFQHNDLIGRAGIEKAFDSILRGENGGRQVEVDARGRQTRVLSERKTRKGSDIVLTVDMRLESRIQEILGHYKGVCGMMDLATGEILAWVSQPSYDPNAFVDPNRLRERLFYLRDHDRPMMDRGLHASYAPGSVFKVVTALAALGKDKLNSNTTFFCKGFFRLKPGSRPFKCWFKQGHQAVNIFKGLERSCNVFFYNLGRMLDPDDIAQMSRRLGIGEPEEVEVSYIKGTVPDRAWKQERFKDRWYQGETISYAIGQGFLSVTPLEIMRMMSVIALENEMPSPHFVRGGKFPAKKVSLARDDLRLVKQGLYRVVQSDYGTGQYGRVSFMKIGGKTGTAQTTRGEDHAWFGGFFPFDEPRMAFVLFVEHGKSGGMIAAKLMKEVLIAWKEITELPQAPSVKTDEPAPSLKTLTPSIQGSLPGTHVG